jgi:hypothetical protein
MLDEGGELVFEAFEGEGGPKVAAQRYVFGHALLEHALAGAPTARAKEVRVALGAALPVDPDARRRLCDAALAAHLRESEGSRCVIFEPRP